MPTLITPDIGWIEDSNNAAPIIDVAYRRCATPEELIDAFPEAPERIFKTNRNCIWFVGEIDRFPVGVVAAEITGPDAWTYRSAYTVPMFRGQGIYEELCYFRDEYVKEFHSGAVVMQYPESRFVDENFEGERRDNMLVGFWPTPETNEYNWTVQEQHFRALAYTYEVEIQIVEKPSQIIVEDKRPWISIEEGRGVPFNEFEYPEKAIYFVGNSDWRHMSDIFEVDHIIHVPTPGGYDHPLYGNQAATLVLHQRLLQQKAAGYEK